MKQQMNLNPNKYVNDPLAQKILKEQKELVKNTIIPTFLGEEYNDFIDDLVAGTCMLSIWDKNIWDTRSGSTIQQAIKACADLGIPCIVVNLFESFRPTTWLTNKMLDLVERAKDWSADENFRIIMTWTPVCEENFAMDDATIKKEEDREIAILKRDMKKCAENGYVVIINGYYDPRLLQQSTEFLDITTHNCIQYYADI